MVRDVWSVLFAQKRHRLKNMCAMEENNKCIVWLGLGGLATAGNDIGQRTVRTRPPCSCADWHDRTQQLVSIEMRGCVRLAVWSSAGTRPVAGSFEGDLNVVATSRLCFPL